METGVLHKVEPKIRRMEYRHAFPAPALSVSSQGAAPQLEESSLPPADKESRESIELLAARVGELEQQLLERETAFALQLQMETAAACERGRREEDSERTVAIEKIAQLLDRALGEFIAARDGYLERVEQEVVRLALSIATRILHREAQMDPLLLSGAVRVALGQLSDTTEVRLRVPLAEHGLWSEMTRLMPNLPLRPQLIADDALLAGECMLETHLGSVDLGVKAQLAEIERGFFDLLEHREPARRDEIKTGTKLEEA